MRTNRKTIRVHDTTVEKLNAHCKYGTFDEKIQSLFDDLEKKQQA